MWGLMRKGMRILSVLIFLTIIQVETALAQNYIVGNITYVSKDYAYVDLGKKDGVAPGDSALIYRKGTLLGNTVVSQASGSSSALEINSIDGEQWKIDDTVKIQVPETIDNNTPLSEELQSGFEIQDTHQVFLDSSAYLPRDSTLEPVHKTQFTPTFSGYISARLDERGGSDSSATSSSSSIYSQLNIRDIGIKYLNARIFLRGRDSADKQSFDAKLYSMMLSYDHPSKPYNYLIGRIYHPQLSMLGTVDGVGLTWKINQHRLALIAGQEATIFNIEDYELRRKFGIAVENIYSWGTFQYGNMTEYIQSSLSRNFILLGSTYRIGRILRVKNYAEIDLDLFEQGRNTQMISITRFRSSLSWKPLRSVNSTFRYSYRENVLSLLDTADTEYEMSARHALNINMTWIMNSSITISGQAGLRTDGDGRQIQMYGVSANQRSFSRDAMSLSGGFMAMFSYLSEGGRAYITIGKGILPWLDIDLYDELFLYRILGESDFRTRHLPEISLSAKVPGLNRLRLRTRFEQEDGELFYRFSLSASRQF